MVCVARIYMLTQAAKPTGTQVRDTGHGEPAAPTTPAKKRKGRGIEGKIVLKLEGLGKDAAGETLFQNVNLQIWQG